jgi:hypothetical protein
VKVTQSDLQRDALAGTRHLLLMYRRQFQDEKAQRKLQRLDRRLSTVVLELRSTRQSPKMRKDWPVKGTRKTRPIPQLAVTDDGEFYLCCSNEWRRGTHECVRHIVIDKRR